MSSVIRQDVSYPWWGNDRRGPWEGLRGPGFLFLDLVADATGLFTLWKQMDVNACDKCSFQCICWLKYHMFNKMFQNKQINKYPAFGMFQIIGNGSSKECVWRRKKQRHKSKLCYERFIYWIKEFELYPQNHETLWRECECVLELRGVKSMASRLWPLVPWFSHCIYTSISSSAKCTNCVGLLTMFWELNTIIHKNI